MRRHRISAEEVEAIVWCPSARLVTPEGVEHYGVSDDGREFKIVTDHSEILVITVSTDEKRRRDWRRKRR
jgi:hypothetical protein